MQGAAESLFVALPPLPGSSYGIGAHCLFLHSLMYSLCLIQEKVLQEPTWLRLSVSPGSLPSWADLPFLSMLPLGHQQDKSGDSAPGNLWITDSTAAEKNFLGRRDYNRRGFTEKFLWQTCYVAILKMACPVRSTSSEHSYFRFRNVPFDAESRLGAGGPAFWRPPFRGKGYFLNHRVQTQLSLLCQS